MNHKRAVYLLKSAILIAVYLAAAIASHRLSRVSGYVALVWPPAGIALAALLIMGMEYWPALAIATVLVTATSGRPFWKDAAAGFGSTLEPILAAYLLKRYAHFDNALARVKDVVGLLIYAALISTLVGATLGVAGLYLAGALPSSDILGAWYSWWVGDVLGILVVAPFLLVWSRRPYGTLGARRTWEAALLMAALGVVGVIVFHGIPRIHLDPFAIEYVIFPLLIWAAMRFRQRGSVTATFIVSTIAIWAVIATSGAHLANNNRDSLLNAQIFMAVSAVTFLAMAAVVTQYTNSQQQQLRLVARTARLSQQRTRLLALNAAKDEFISIASHQLRTPATAVKQYVGMLLHDYAGQLTPAQRKMLTVAYENNERQLRATNDLLNVAQIDTGTVILHKEPVDLNSLVVDVLQAQAADLEARQQVHTLTSRANAKYIVLADRVKLGMVLENLVSNASKYSHPGKPIEIRLRKVDNSASISITDQGVGMSKADSRKLFKKFTRPDNTRSIAVGGMGLGLYWAKRIIDLHGGKIKVTSVLGNGSTFTVTLPLTKAKSKNLRAMQTPQKARMART